MSRYATADAPKPTGTAQPTLEGDQQFIGLQMKLDRDKLPAGYLARAENNRLNRGVAEPRPGTLTPVFANVLPPADMFGSGIYSNPNGQEMILVAHGSEVIRIRSGSYPGSVFLPEGITLATEPVEFVQHFDKVLLHQPNELPTYVWDGMSGTGFVPITKSNPEDTSTVLMPNPPWSVNFADRAIFPIPGEPDQIGVSDILDYTSYDPILMKFRINRGTADKIVGVYPYPTSNLIIGKNRGLDVITNFSGDLSNAAVETLSSEIGICARRSGKMVGADLFFLSADHFGVYRVSEVIQNRLQSEPIPVSDSIAPLIRRINWPYAGGAVANVHGIYYMLAVPLDHSTTNNAVLVFNTVTKEWESGPDLWNDLMNLRLNNLLVTDYFGQAALYGINHYGRHIHVLGIGSDDELEPGNGGSSAAKKSEINHLMEARAYATLGWNAATNRDFKRLEIPVATLRPSITVTALPDAAGDERVFTPTPITRNPLKYRTFARAVRDYAPDNSGKDFEAPGREDYTLDVSTIDFDLTEPGVELEIKQRDVLRFSTKIGARAVSYRIENKQGKCEVGGALVESAGTQRAGITRKAA